MSAALKIFIIYAREDRGYKDDLLKSLKLLQTQGFIEPWHDSDIKPGDEWDKEIKAHLRAADIILPIISFDFFDSDYIHRVEIVEAFERYDRGEALIIPIIADSCPWTDYPRLKNFQVLPAEGKPIDDWSDKKKAMSSIYEGVKKVVLEGRQKSADEYFNMASKTNNFYQKIGYYSHAINVHPTGPDAYHFRGYAKYVLKQYVEAIKDYDKAIYLDPENYFTYNARGLAKYALGQYSEAIKDYNEAIRFDHPDYVEVYNNRGAAKEKLGLLEEAKNDLQKALKINPNHLSTKHKLWKLVDEMNQKP